jgi:hypothetical protein
VCFKSIHTVPDWAPGNAARDGYVQLMVPLVWPKAGAETVTEAPFFGP